ncbi:hypothetical protein ACLB2K_045928 [Fragaria x ananassa]
MVTGGRNVGDSLIAQFIYTGNGFYLQLNDLMRFSDLIDTIRRRFRFSSSDVFHLQYSSPGCLVIYLYSDLDFKMLFCCAKIYKLDHVDVNVVKDVGSSCSSKSVLFDESFSEIIDENDYLDDGFKDGPTKSYLLDDWGSYLLHKGQKFESVQDFRDKLRNWYKDAILETNLGSSFVLEVKENTNRFQRVFVAYGGQVEGFKFSLPVLYVDGTFGKSIYKGQILSATGRNGDKGFFPLALCICDSETEDNWFFFFKHLKALLEPQGRVITFINDRGGGLLKAFNQVFPVLQKFFKIAYASTERAYYHHLQALRDEGVAKVIDEFIAEIPLENWCRAFFKGCRYGIMANSIAESFNKWIVAERSMPPLTMIDQTRMKEMKMMFERRVESKSWTTQLTPEMEKKLVERMHKAYSFRVIASQESVYEVRDDEYSYSVNLSTHTCSCVKWMSYSFPIHPVSNVDACTEESILPPITKRPDGRPKAKKIKSSGEKKPIRCGRCLKLGHHNRQSCTKPLNGQ